MLYPANSIANLFIEVAKNNGDSMTQMKLHKLIYYAHGWYLALKGNPLIDESVQAWRFGPVIPSVYAEFRRFGATPITGKATMYERNPSGHANFVEYPKPQDDYVINLVNQVYDIYGKIPTGRLSTMTHETDSPWSKATEHGTIIEPFKKIDNELIMEYFKSKKKNQNP